MPIGTPVERHAARTLFNGVTQSLSPASNVAAGTHAILFTGCATKLISSVSDSVGNAWTVDRTYATGALSVASCSVVTQIQTTDTISITYDSTGNENRDQYISEVSGLAVAPFDQGADADGAASGSFSIGPTGTLAQADEIGFAFLTDETGGRTITAMSGWTGSTTPDFTAGHLYYKIVASTDALTSSGTWNLATAWQGTVVTFKAAPVLSPLPFGPIASPVRW